MDDRENRRPTERRGSAATRERPTPPRRRPQAARPRTGTASEQARARQERLAARAAAAEAVREEPRQTRSRPVTKDSGATRAVRPVEPAAEEAAQQPERTERADRSKAAARRRSTDTRKQKRARKKKPHRIYNTNFGFKFLTMLAVVGVIVLAMLIFFRVRHIETAFRGVTDRSTATDAEGNPIAGISVESADGTALSYYTAQEIIDASGINVDDNLLSLSKAAVASRIHAALPYINEIQIKKKLPSTVIITVSEFTVTYSIQDLAGQWWLISREGRVLEPADAQIAKNHMVVTGMPIQVPNPGDYIKPVATDGADLSEIAAKRTATLTALPLLERSSFAKQIVSMDVSTSYDIILWYGTQYEIKLGNTENLEYKLQYLQAVLEELGKEKSGTIDLTFTEDNGAHFLPFG